MDNVNVFDTIRDVIKETRYMLTCQTKNIEMNDGRIRRYRKREYPKSQRSIDTSDKENKSQLTNLTPKKNNVALRRLTHFRTPDSNNAMKKCITASKRSDIDECPARKSRRLCYTEVKNVQSAVKQKSDVISIQNHFSIATTSEVSTINREFRIKKRGRRRLFGSTEENRTEMNKSDLPDPIINERISVNDECHDFFDYPSPIKVTDRFITQNELKKLEWIQYLREHPERINDLPDPILKERLKYIPAEDIIQSVLNPPKITYLDVAEENEIIILLAPDEFEMAKRRGRPKQVGRSRRKDLDLTLIEKNDSIKRNKENSKLITRKRNKNNVRRWISPRRQQRILRSMI